MERVWKEARFDYFKILFRHMDLEELQKFLNQDSWYWAPDFKRNFHNMDRKTNRSVPTLGILPLRWQ
jgi:hypothetical protein